MINRITSYTAKYEVINGRIIPVYNKQPLRGENLNKIEVNFDFQNNYRSI